MITKERLQETIRRVIGEFKRTKRIPEPMADELSAALEAGVDHLFDQEASAHSVDEMLARGPTNHSEFEADMQTFAKGTEHLPPYSGTSSRTFTSTMAESSISASCLMLNGIALRLVGCSVDRGDDDSLSI